jgi:T5SS/PEP-CTERM-associated repeat protein
MTGSSSGAVVFVGMDGQPVQINPGGYYTSYGDSAIQSLLSTVPSAAKVAIYSVLDVGSQSLVDTTALVYGHAGDRASTNSPRLAPVTLSSVGAGAGWGPASPYTSVYATGGDSASPTFVPWVNPVTGEKTLTLLGTRTFSQGDSVLAADVGVTNVWNHLAETGYALRYVANPDQWWTGGAGSGDFGSSGNWTSNTPVAKNTVVFDAANAGGQLGVNLGGVRMMNGVYFKAADGSGDGFTITNGTLGLDKAGMINYDNDAQTLKATMVFGAPQTWDGKAGGFVVGGVMTNNGYLLVMDGTGVNTLRDGELVGTGAFTKEGAGLLVVEGTNSLGGHVWVHDGTMVMRGGMFTATNIVNGTNATIRLNSDTGGRLVVSNGVFTMRDMHVGNEAGFGGAYQVDGGSNAFWGNLSIGHAAGATGTVAVTGGELVGLGSSQLRIGDYGNGSLVVSGGTVRSLNTYVGYQPRVLGTLAVHGGAVYVTNSGVVLFVGMSGTGVVSQTGGLIQAAEARVGGNNAGGVGMWNVNGGTSSVTIARLGVFAGTTGIVTVGGGRFEYTTMNVGYTSGATGAVVVTGGELVGLASSQLRIGESGAGSLVVSGGVVRTIVTYVGVKNAGSVAIDGGRMEYMGMYVGRGASNVGSVVVGGGALVGLSGSSLYVGESSHGTLRVTDGLLNPVYLVAGWSSGMVGRIQLDGGNLVADSMDLGYYTNALGVCSINGGSFTLTNAGKRLSLGVKGGRGELWQSNGLLRVGDVRVGSSAVSSGYWEMDGGTAMTANVFLGYAGASTGTVTMGGGQFVVTNATKTALFQVGCDGAGSLVLNGGVLRVDRLVATNGGGGSSVSLAGGTLISGSSLFGAGTTLRLGVSTGAVPSILNLGGGMHQFGGGLLLGSNAMLNGIGGVVGNVTNFGTIAPGNSPGAITNYGSLTLMDSSVLSFELGGTSRGVNYDTLVVTNVASLAGLLSVKFSGGFETNVQATDTFTLLSAANLTGFFNDIASGGRLATSDGYGSFLTTYDSGTDMIVLSGFQAIPEPSALTLLAAGVIGGLLLRRRSTQPAHPQTGQGDLRLGEVDRRAAQDPLPGNRQEPDVRLARRRGLQPPANLTPLAQKRVGFSQFPNLKKRGSRGRMDG